MSASSPVEICSKLPVWVVDRDDVRFSIRFALATHNFNAMTYASGEAFLQDTNLMQPGCAVLDLTMESMSGLDVQRVLNEANSPIEVIILSGHGSIPAVVTAMKNGAISFLEKPVDPYELIQKVQLGLDRSMKKWQCYQMNLLLQTFSRREAQIFDLVCQGLTNNEIADKLFLSQRTVEVHRSHITKKLGSHTPISVLYELARCSGNSIDLLTSKRRKPVPQPPTFARASVQVVTPLQGNKGTLTYPIPTGGSISIVPPRGNDKK